MVIRNSTPKSPKGDLAVYKLSKFVHNQKPCIAIAPFRGLGVILQISI
jgi:hypothetical protein